MTSAAEPAGAEHADARTIITGGIKLGILTAAGVTVFALLSRAMTGTPEIIVQSLLVLVGGIAFSFVPALWVQPRSTDGIAWTALVGLLSALTFTVFDTALLRPLDLYHWTWDRIGGGSGFWYIPVWWMLSAVLAWLGGWIWAAASRDGRPVGLAKLAGLAAAICAVVFAILALTRIAPAGPAVVGLAWLVALLIQLVVAHFPAKR
jgi:hypothetical protein